MEEKSSNTVHRISAQRVLNFDSFIPLKSEKQASNALLFGDENTFGNKGRRWNYKPATSVPRDFNYVLSLLVAKQNSQEHDFVEKCRKAEEDNKGKPDVPEMIKGKFCSIWDKIFPQRKVEIKDAQVIAALPDESKRYPGTEMSDGERVGLYLILQSLLIPENKTIIVDEPEIHLHSSIMNRLWTEIEKTRPDCLFIYITHDTQFATVHKQSKKIWVKEFDGNKWQYGEIQSSNLPEQLSLDILGNKKKVLFVEGTLGSYDTKLYFEIYKDYYVVPCGGCRQVINNTKAMKETEQLNNHLECYGIIDRDYRSEDEIKELKEHGIYTLQVAEVENLFLVEELLEIVNDHMQHSDKSRIDEAKKFVLDCCQKQKDDQVKNFALEKIKYKMRSAKDKNDMERTLSEYDKIEEDYKNKFKDNLEYKDILKISNKSLAKSIGKYFGLLSDGYLSLVVGLLQGDEFENIKNALSSYLPMKEEIPY
ncbi:MAG: DUF4435 domain-containing protein [Holosporales bacterium]|nr:DUF4435 domain-containing protein [Holosporales bacterium]